MNTRMIGAILALGAPAFGQRLIEFGVKIGIPVSESFQTGSFQFLATGLHEGHSATRRYTAGADLVLRLPGHFGVEAGVLYKRLGYDLTSSSPALPVVNELTWTTGNSWEFPLLGVYRPPHLLHLAPRISAGVSFRAVSGGATTGQCLPLASQYSNFCAVTAPTPQPQDWRLDARSSRGGTFGAGIETRVGPMRLTPEIRYTRWQANAGEEETPFDLRSNRNQIDFLLDIGF